MAFSSFAPWEFNSFGWWRSLRWVMACGGGPAGESPFKVDSGSSMKRHLRLFAFYFAQYTKVRLAYKADFLIAFFSSMAATVLGFGFVWVLFSKIPKLQGWSFYEILFLYAFS